MNELQRVFNYGEMEVRTVMKGGEPWFVAKDVCAILAHSNPTMALNRLDDEERSKFNLGRQGEANVVNESGLYELIFASRKPEAKLFKTWVKKEVLPTIRKHGAYMTPDTLEQAIANPDFMIGLLTNLKEEQAARKKLEAQVAEDAPKISYYDTILQSTNAVNITQIAQDYGLSGGRLNGILREAKVQRKVGGQWVLYQQYKSLGFAKSKTIPIGHGQSRIHTQWTQKGRLFIHELLGEQGIHPVVDSVA